MSKVWDHVLGDGPLVAAAIHAGHALRDEVAAIMKLPEPDRLREQDPYTEHWIRIAPTRIVATHSRFQVDLNRPRDRAVYRTPEDAWGLWIWSEELHEELVRRSLAEHDAFYEFMEELLQRKVEEHGCFVLLDIHSYNHRRDGPSRPEAASEDNPMVNVGTGTMERGRWERLVNRFMSELGAFDFPGGSLDVRENVRFRGGNLARWVHERFPETGCALAVEFKKFYMDEWTGQPEWSTIEAIERALSSTVPGLLEELERM